MRLSTLVLIDFHPSLQLAGGTQPQGVFPDFSGFTKTYDPILSTAFSSYPALRFCHPAGTNLGGSGPSFSIGYSDPVQLRAR
jgi:hypothetical protein